MTDTAAPESNTALWHAYELGRIAYLEGDLYITPFENRVFYQPLSVAWKRGWDYERDEERTKKSV